MKMVDRIVNVLDPKDVEVNEETKQNYEPAKKVFSFDVPTIKSLQPSSAGSILWRQK